MRDAQSLLDQVISFTGPKVEDRHVTEILGIIGSDIIFEASRAMIEGSPGKCLEIVDRIYNYGYDIKEFYRALMGQFRNLLINTLAPQNSLLDMNESEEEEAGRQAELAGSEKLQILLNFLINREQDLRFTSNPRLILETTMIKLCYLGDYLSMGDLLEKISSLEKRLVAASATIEQPKADHISDPGAQWVSGNREIEQAEPKSEPESGQSWDDFLSYLSSKNRFMFSILKDWQFLKLTEKTLEIAKGEQSFSSGFFDDKERHEQLSSYCRDFFQRDILIKIVANSRPQSQKKLSSTMNHPEPEAAKNADLPPPVQDILHMFQGEIKKGDPSKQTGPHSSKEMKK